MELSASREVGTIDIGPHPKASPAGMLVFGVITQCRPSVKIGNPQCCHHLKDSTAYSPLRPTKLDKIKNLYHCVRLGAVISHHLYATWRSALPRVGTEGLRRSFNPCSASGCNSPNRRIPLKDRQLAIRPNTFRLNTPSRECTHPAMLTRVWDSVLTGAKQGEFLVHQLLFVPHDSPPFIYFPLGHGYDKAPLPPTPQIGAPVHRC